MSKPRLRWNGIMWCAADRLFDCWRYWRLSRDTCWNLFIEPALLIADSSAELLPLDVGKILREKRVWP